MRNNYLPPKQGLYDPRFEHDSCGVGFVCNLNGKKTHDMISKGIEVLERMSHRGAVGADPETGDGAGILIQIPHTFYKEICSLHNMSLPGEGDYGTGMVFFPGGESERSLCRKLFEEAVADEGQDLIGWREVPTDSFAIGKTARDTQPVIEQIFIERGKNTAAGLDFERKLYVIRKVIEAGIKRSGIEDQETFYITNLSARTISYKGLLMPAQVASYYPELKDERIKSALALVHSRYSTNTFPTWDLAQPFRYLAHNGEINTLRGNINWFRAGERLLASKLFGSDIEKIKPVIVEGGSDSATIDNVFELLFLSGRPLTHVMMMLIPPAWERNNDISAELRDFYRYHACIMEPWDGPAAMAFTDGKDIAAVLDRNGLRPARYIVTKDGFVVMSSEAGVLDIDPADIVKAGRLEPGKMLFINTDKGQIIDDDEVKSEVAKSRPYSEWTEKNILELDSLLEGEKEKQRHVDLLSELKMFGYSREDMKRIIIPMAQEAKEPVMSMGNDTPHAVLSKKPQVLYNYFKQLFAQVTNPAIDPIREELIMSLDTYIGEGENILDETPKHCHKVRVRRPLLTNEQLEALRNININGFRTKTIYTHFDPAGGEKAFKGSLDRVCAEAEFAIEQGYSFVILSDRGVDKGKAALPTLLASSAVHQHLVRKTVRSEINIIVESGEPREVHHFALLLGYGVDCINPYLAYAAVEDLAREGSLDIPAGEALINYRAAVYKGILKILSKMGIATLRSYRGSQIFEALGLEEEFNKKYFTGTVCRIGGAGIKEIAEETIKRHKAAFPERACAEQYLDTGGLYQWKKDGEFHLWRPESIAALQDSVRKEDYSRYCEFAKLINEQGNNPTTIRSLFKLKKTSSVPLEEVESIENIVKRFATGAMSFGSISRGAHESIAIAMNRLGARSNTGEGGEDPARFIRRPDGDLARSAIKQVASGRFGVTTNYLVNADEVQIKIAQGAKPGEGGQLPGHKVSVMIAKTRYTMPGVTLISPPPHHDIYSIEDLAQLIFDLKNVNPSARISVKLVSEAGIGTVAAGVVKGHADMILVSGGDGGTGASPLSSIRHAGLPWELGLSETHQTLVLNNLRNRVRLQTDGQMRTGRDVVMAALLGAEEYGFCTAVLITLGCVMLRHCHLNNCSLGVATQDALLEKRFKGRPEYVVTYLQFIAREVREIMADLGFRSMDEMIGRTDLIEADTEKIPEKAHGIDLSRILYKPATKDASELRCTIKQDHGIDTVLDRKLIESASNAIDNREKIELFFRINNSDRTTGAMLSGEVCRRHGEGGLPEDTLHCSFSGVAGQSFGAFLSKGITFELEGLANDYVGKGISGGKIVIYPSRDAGYVPEENIIMGNTSFYGAIAGEAYIRGLAGERFCIRNSGLYAVVEGIGDHGCEYMTGGRVVIIGKTGRNFAAGMSGGIAYVYDEDGKFDQRCNKEMVTIESIEEEDRTLIYSLLRKHCEYTDSSKAEKILDLFEKESVKFRKVMPMEYKRILEAKKIEEEMGLLETSDG